VFYRVAPQKTSTEALRVASRTFPPPRQSSVCHPEENQGLAALVQVSRNNEIVYELKPSLEACFVGGLVHTTQAGIRAMRDYAPSKPVGTFRILGLGDSLMFGQGVNNSDVYTVKMEQQLSGRLKHPVEFINMAVPGYNTAIEVAMLAARGLNYHPDLIILHWCENDMGLPFFLEKGQADFSLRQSALLDFIRRDWGLLLEIKGEVIQDPKLILDRTPIAYRYMVGFEGVVQALDRLQTLTMEPRHIPVLVVAKNFANTCVAAAVLERAFTSRGFHVLQIGERSHWWLTSIDAHLNATGHSGYATMITDALDAMGLLPGGRSERELQ